MVLLMFMRISLGGLCFFWLFALNFFRLWPAHARTRSCNTAICFFYLVHQFHLRGIGCRCRVFHVQFMKVYCLFEPLLGTCKFCLRIIHSRHIHMHRHHLLHLFFHLCHVLHHLLFLSSLRPLHHLFLHIHHSHHHLHHFLLHHAVAHHLLHHRPAFLHHLFHHPFIHLHALLLHLPLLLTLHAAVRLGKAIATSQCHNKNTTDDD